MKDLPPLQWLRSFEAAARHLSFTHAAAELSVTQSAISQQIKALESHLGYPLFVRKTRSLELTDTGFSYLPHIQSALAILKQSTRAYFDNKKISTVTVRSNFAFSSLWLTPRLPDFIKNHPKISLHIIPALWESDYRHSSEYIEIRFGSGSWTDNYIPLQENLISYPVCAPILAKSIHCDADLGKIPLIASTWMMQQWSDYFKLIGIDHKANTAQFATPSFNIALEMCKLGLGAVLTHDLITIQSIDDGSLVRVSDTVAPMPEKYYLHYQPNQLSDAEQQFCHWLLAQFDINI